MRPLGYPVTILNTIDQLGKFDGKADEGFFVEYSFNSKAFRVFNCRTKIVEENFHIRFSENTLNVVGQARKETEHVKDYILKPLWMANPPFSHDPKSSHDDGFKPSSDNGKKVDEDLQKENECNDQEKEDNVNSTNNVNIVSSIVNVTGINDDSKLPFDPNMPTLEDVSTFNFSNNDEDDGFEDPNIPVRVYKVEKALYRLHQAPRALYETLSTYLLDNGFQRGKIDKTLFIKRHKEVKTASTRIETQKPLLKDESGEEVDVHMYRSMIGSLMYLTSLRPDIMFAVCACARYQLNLMVSRLYAMKRIF
nr:retrotransposon protein, putative, unclassified [Tanacetum cinerariifolium]